MSIHLKEQREEAVWEEHLREKSPVKKGPEQVFIQRDGDECEQIRGTRSGKGL